MAVIYLVRHGQASWDADDYDVLSETGWEQSRLLGAALAARVFQPLGMADTGFQVPADKLARAAQS